MIVVILKSFELKGCPRPLLPEEMLDVDESTARRWIKGKLAREYQTEPTTIETR